MKIKALIYDCVGVLLIKKKDWNPSKEVFKINNQCGSVIDEKKFWRKIKKEDGYTGSEINSVVDLIASGYKKNILMWQFNDQVKYQYKTGIINNGTAKIFKKWIDKFNLDKNFDVLLNSSSVGIKKPNKKIYKIMCAKLNVLPTECIFIDDDIKNVATACHISMRGIYYNFQKHNSFLKKVNLHINNKPVC